jgi:hypothetical protein
MRHRGGNNAAGKTVGNGVSGTLSKLTDLLSDEQPPAGRHRLPTSEPVIPIQKMPTHETLEPLPVEEAAPAAPAVADHEAVEAHVAAVAEQVVAEPEVEHEADPSILPEHAVPAHALWRAGHGPRVFAAALLLFAVAGTSALGLRYAETRSTDEFISLVIGVAVIVGLWALLIASTPQVVSLRGSILTVRNSSGSERFDLADGLQPVDVIGEPRSSQWALLLHRANNTSVVLRRRDVDAVALDPIVRHYRAMADRRYGDRKVRFSR